ncbi:MAG: hypothetical protein Q9171_007503 [Xanthocarpia ochracea]
MALAHRSNFSHHHTEFPLSNKVIKLPNEILKSYLPRLWRLEGRWAKAKGYLDLEELGIVRGHYCQVALLVLLKALKASDSGYGVASELKTQLGRALADHASHAPSPGHAMAKIFGNVAKLIRKLSRHQEMAYAMTEWFATFAAENNIHPEPMFHYIVALDQLRVNMTGPLRSLLRHGPLTSADITIICEPLRPKTRKTLISLWKEHKKQGLSRRSTPSSEQRLVEGGDVCWRDIKRKYLQDPDSIIVRLGPRNRAVRDRYETDDDYSTDTDITDDDDCWPYGHGQPHVRDPSSYHALHGSPPILRRPLIDHPPFLAQPRRCSPLIMKAGHPVPCPVRPIPARFHSFPFTHIGGL